MKEYKELKIIDNDFKIVLFIFFDYFFSFEFD